MKTIASLLLLLPMCNAESSSRLLASATRRWGQGSVANKRESPLQSIENLQQVSDIKDYSAIDPPAFPSIDKVQTVKRSKKSEKKKATLNFGGAYTHTLDSIKSDRVDQFLRPDSPDHIGLLLKGGDFPIERVEPTPELVKQWRQRASEYGWEYDNDGDDHEIYRVRNIIPLVSGLELHAESIMGCRRVHEDKPSPMVPKSFNSIMKHRMQPRQKSVYEFTLIDDHVVPRGSKFLVWLYAQCSGEPKKAVFPNADPDRRRQTFAHMRVTADENSLRIDGTIRTQCKVPKKVITFLPMSQSKTESKVSKSMQSALEDETVRSAEKFTSAFVEWCKGK